MIYSAVKVEWRTKTTAQTEREQSPNLYFSGTEFQSVLVGGENAQAFVRIRV